VLKGYFVQCKEAVTGVTNRNFSDLDERSQRWRRMATTRRGKKRRQLKKTLPGM
jgi:hypothetical protein